jgi:hypothetical protein
MKICNSLKVSNDPRGKLTIDKSFGTLDPPNRIQIDQLVKLVELFAGAKARLVDDEINM